MDCSLLVSSYSARLKGRKISQQQMLYEALREAILDGQITPGARLVPTRVFAEELGIARNSVLWAYERLSDEGFLESGRQGSIVSDLRHSARASLNTSHRHTPETRLSLRTSTSLARPPAAAMPEPVRPEKEKAVPDRHPTRALLSPGIPALDAFPIAKWRSAIERAWRQAGPAELGHTYAHGHPALRHAIAAYLRVSRSVRCDAANIIVTDSTHTSLDICARTLLSVDAAMTSLLPHRTSAKTRRTLGRSDIAETIAKRANPRTVWIENPGYSGAKAVFPGAGIDIVPMPVDRDGIVVSSDDWQRVPPALIYVTPSHQYPLGCVLSMARRHALVEQARAHGAWIVEDDYDSEFRHDGTPLPALQGLSDASPVIYLGTFSKTLFPALRIAFMVVPDALTAAVARATQTAKRQGRLVDQLALAGFIESGAYTVHLRRMRRLYAQRRAALLTAIAGHLSGRLTVSGGETGMHLTVRLDAPLRDVEVARKTAAIGLSVSPLSEYCYESSDKPLYNGFVLGYANLPTDEAEACAQRLAQVIDDMMNETRAQPSDERRTEK